MCERTYKIGNATLNKRINSKEIHKGKYFFTREPNESEEV